MLVQFNFFLSFLYVVLVVAVLCAPREIERDALKYGRETLCTVFELCALGAYIMTTACVCVRVLVNIIWHLVNIIACLLCTDTAVFSLSFRVSHFILTSVWL